MKGREGIEGGAVAKIQHRFFGSLEKSPKAEIVLHFNGLISMCL